MSNSANGEIFGHPKGLYVLFFTEMWERFSYYGMRALLMLYMLNHFLWSQEKASFHYKWYVALVYFTPLIGGWLADRYLGNKRAVVIGALMMAIGHFLMAFETYSIFLGALVFLIIGNGFFKPNMSVQVGRLYRHGDKRRDGAYTIFYMGINLGAFLTPLICGTLGEKVGWHWGFGAAGVGMVAGLIIYLAGQKWINEISGGQQDPTTKEDAPTEGHHHTEVSDAGFRPHPISIALRYLLALAAPGFMIAGVVLWKMEKIPGFDVLFFAITAITAGIMSYVSFQLRGKTLDRVSAIYAVMLFIICFWAAFEQAGNVMNIWAEKHTDRYVFAAAPLPSSVPVSPDAADVPVPPAGAAWEMPATWFQSINPLYIVLLAPLFAIAWTKLASRGKNPSIPAKMASGIFLMGLSMVVMLYASRSEDGPTVTTIVALPDSIHVADDGQLGHMATVKGKEHFEPFSFGRFYYDRGENALKLKGVLTDLERDRILRYTADPTYVEVIEQLKRSVKEAQETGDGEVNVRVKLETLPAGFDFGYTVLASKDFEYDPNTHEIIAKRRIADRDEKMLLLAGADPILRAALWDMHVQSAKHRVAVWWLMFHYLLATMGELCLSPVGLAMVSKLAPVKFATMLMGLWLMTSFFGNFAAGAFGEIWGKFAPESFFKLFIVILITAAVLLMILARPIKNMMHGVD